MGAFNGKNMHRDDLSGYDNPARVTAGMIQKNRGGVARKVLGKTVTPLDNGNMRAEQVFLESDRLELLWALDPVEVEMVQIDRHSPERAMIDVEERKRRAGKLGRAAETVGDAFHEFGLARAQITFQADPVSGPKRCGEPPSICTAVRRNASARRPDLPEK